MKVKLIITLLLISACTSNVEKFSMPVFHSKQSIEFEHVSDELIITRPNHLFDYGDWIILIAFAGNGQDTFYLYEKNSGNLLLSGIKYANGPKEVTTGLLNVSLQDGILSYNDMQTGKRVFFSIDDYVINGTSAINEDSFEVYPWINYMEEAGNKQILFSNKGYLSKDTTSIPRIQIINEQGHSEQFDQATIDDPAIRFWTYMQPYTTVSPDKSKLAVASGLGGILETFTISSGIQIIGTSYFFGPEIMVANGTYEFTDKALMGFNDICSTDKRVIASFDSINKYKEREGLSEASKKKVFTDIATFDWKGKPDILYHSEYRIEKLCANQDEKMIYAITQEADGSYYIVRAKINL